MTQEHEIIIIGGGPAGLTAGIYAARARRRTVLLEKHGAGGQMALTWEVENYPGVEKISGYDLGQIMERQARGFRSGDPQPRRHRHRHGGRDAPGEHLGG